MRIATLTLGLILGGFFLLQSVVLAAIGGVFDVESASTFGVAGVTAVVLWVFGSGLVFGAPRVSMGLFLLSAGACFLLGRGLGDLVIWGASSLGLAGLAYLSIEEKRSADADRALLRAVAQMLLSSKERAAEPAPVVLMANRPMATTPEGVTKMSPATPPSEPLGQPRPAIDPNFDEPSTEEAAGLALAEAAYGLSTARRARSTAPRAVIGSEAHEPS